MEERKRVSHLASTYEAKKGTTRIEFDRKGQNRDDRTLRGLTDLFFDGPKRLYNSIIDLLRLPDVRKLNTIENWDINGKIVLFLSLYYFFLILLLCLCISSLP